MTDDSKHLYILGGITAILSGLMMIFLTYWFTFESNRFPEIMHGVGVGMTILIVPTVIAITILLIREAKTGALLGVAFAALWLIIELLAHSSQTAPLKKINELIAASTTQDAETAIKSVWLDWTEALTLLGAFLFSVSAICYGASLRKWGNSISAYLLILSAIVYVLTFIPFVNFNWHYFIRGIALLFLSGVLFQAPNNSVEEVWDS